MTTGLPFSTQDTTEVWMIPGHELLLKNRIHILHNFKQDKFTLNRVKVIHVKHTELNLEHDTFQNTSEGIVSFLPGSKIITVEQWAIQEWLVKKTH